MICRRSLTKLSTSFENPKSAKTLSELKVRLPKFQEQTEVLGWSDMDSGRGFWISVPLVKCLLLAGMPTHLWLVIKQDITPRS